MVPQDDRTKQLEVRIDLQQRGAARMSQPARLTSTKLLLASEIIYNAAQAMTKISLLLQYRRIFRGMRTRLVSLWLMILVSAWCVASIVLDSFACTPMAILNPHLEGNCLKSL